MGATVGDAVGICVGDGVGEDVGNGVGSCVGFCVVSVAESMLTPSNVLVPDSDAIAVMDEASDPSLNAAATAAPTLALTSSSCCDASTATVVVIVAPEARSARRPRRDEMAHSWGAKSEALTPIMVCASARFMTVSSAEP